MYISRRPREDSSDSALTSEAQSIARLDSRSSHFDLLWLVYSVFFFADPVQRHQLLPWLVLAVLYPSFLGLYLALLYCRSRALRFVLLAALGVLGIAYYPFNQGAAVVFIYVSAFAPYVFESVAISVGIITASIATAIIEGLALHLSPWNWGIFAFFCVPAGVGNLFSAMRKRANHRLLLAHEQIEHLAKVAERERIARDLHDVLGHTLSLIVLKSELAGRVLNADPQRAQREIGEIEQTARKALSEVREAVGGYRAQGLDAELARARQTLALAGVALESEGHPPRLEPVAESVLSLALREAVTNIVRHARASRCRLSVTSDCDRTRLVLRDNGRGGIEHEGNGLRGMRERIASLGGRLAIESAEGTTLTIEIPAGAAAPQTVRA